MQPANTSTKIRRHSALYFALTIVGFSFWFWLVVPFASHRETYWWLAKVHSEPFSHSLGFIASTYRPVHQMLTWLEFIWLDPSVFPTDMGRQLLAQCLNYVLFLIAWGLMFRGSSERRSFAVVAAVSGAVFFSGYLQLLHLYGLTYAPVMLMTGILVGWYGSGPASPRETPLALLALVLVVWHPFATALFLGFYFGWTIETWAQRRVAERLRAMWILAAAGLAVILIVVLLPRLASAASVLVVETARRPPSARLLALLVSYTMNEVNLAASIVAGSLAVATTLGSPGRLRVRLVLAVVVAVWAISVGLQGMPVLTTWFAAVLLKLALLRHWRLFFLALTAILLPFGGGIGSPSHGMFAIAVCAFATPIGWARLEAGLGRHATLPVGAVIACAILALVWMRLGGSFAPLERLARPLLAERERTYQLEEMLAFLRGSPHCARNLRFAEAAGNPVDDIEGALRRTTRPPASVEDVQLYWSEVLKCRKSSNASQVGEPEIVLTFGEVSVPDAMLLNQIPGRHAGPASAWLPTR